MASQNHIDLPELYIDDDEAIYLENECGNDDSQQKNALNKKIANPVDILSCSVFNFYFMLHFILIYFTFFLKFRTTFTFCCTKKKKFTEIW